MATFWSVQQLKEELRGVPMKIALKLWELGKERKMVEDKKNKNNIGLVDFTNEIHE